MTLKLRVISEQSRRLGKKSYCLFSKQGGRIGRCADNEWVLPDPDRYLSSYHAQVTCETDRWILEDISTNGVFMNDAALPLSQLGPCELHDGDRLRMGDYQMLVSIITSHNPRQNNSENKTASRSQAVPPKQENKQFAPPALNIEFDINKLFISPKADSTQPQDAQIWPPIENLVTVNPHLISNETETDQNNHTLEADGPEHSIEKTDSQLNAGLAAFCKGAGIEMSLLLDEPYSDLLSRAGQLLRETVLGMMAINTLQNEITQSLDTLAPNTQRYPNHCLDQITSVDESIIKLLKTSRARPIHSADGLRARFNNLLCHQRALLSATHKATNNLMERVDPTELQVRFERILNRDSKPTERNNEKYWDMYKEFFYTLNQRNNNGLPKSYSHELCCSYHEQFNSLIKIKNRAS